MSRTGKFYRYFALVFITFAFTLAGIILRQKNTRKIFYFPVYGSSETIIEERYLPKNSSQDKVQLFVDELFLGPETERGRPLFNKGTRVEFCFVRNHVLYLSVTEKAIEDLTPESDISGDIQLLKQNIRKNFPQINEIIFYISGHEASSANIKIN